MNRDIKDKTILITGATDGIGRATAEELAKHMPKLILVGRNKQKGDEVVDEIMASSGNKNIEFMTADLSSGKDIHRLAENFKKKYKHLDVLINNAGAVFSERILSEDGYEMTLALNHLNYFLLTNLLLDEIKDSSPARIINVSSMAHASANLNLEDLNAEKKFSLWSAYANSKLMNLYFTYELARKLEGTGITVNAVHPGLVRSKFGSTGGGLLMSAFRLIQRHVGKTPQNGAKTSIYLALSDEVEGKTGGYYADEKISQSSTISRDPAIAKKLWELSEKMTGLSR